MAAERNHFNINLGDTIYSDSEVGGVPAALTVPAKWAKYRRNLSFGHLRNLRRGTGPLQPLGRSRVHQRLHARGAPQADLPRRCSRFHGLRPRDVSSRNGLYRTFRWGKHLELFFLDERSFRSAKVRTVCGNDLAPTAPQAVRDAFAALVPSLAKPGRARLPRRRSTIPAGRCSVRASTRRSRRAIRGSTATWKVIVNEVPIQQFYALPYDRWEGYEAERDQAAPVPAGEHEERSLPGDGHPRELRQRSAPATHSSGAGPVGTGDVGGRHRPRGHEHAEHRGRSGRWAEKGLGSAIVALFYKPAPPRRRRHEVRERKRLQLRRSQGHGGGDHRHAEGQAGQGRPRGDRRGLRALHVQDRREV